MVDIDNYDEKLDYCTLFPDHIAGVNYNYGCYLHDRHYRNERKTRLTRKEADLLLQREVFKKFKGKGKIKYCFGFCWSWIMFLGVRLFARRCYIIPETA